MLLISPRAITYLQPKQVVGHPLRFDRELHGDRNSNREWYPVLRIGCCCIVVACDGEFCSRCAAYSHLVPRPESPKILDQHQIAAARFERCVQERAAVGRHGKAPARLPRDVGNGD